LESLAISIKSISMATSYGFRNSFRILSKCFR
jgi:hypothetical protein